MAKDNLLYYSFRLNVNNPQHVKVINVLQDLDPEYKSRNQFLVDAAEFYIDHLGEENITVKGAEEKANRKGYITRAEFDELKEQLVMDIKVEAKDEIIRLLMGSIVGNQNISMNQFHQESMNGNTKQKELSDNVMEGLAGKWS